MEKNTAEIIKKQIWGIVKSGILCFLLYLLLSIPMNIIFYSDVPADGSRNFTPVHIATVFIYAAAFYLGYVKKNCETYEENMKDTFSFKECLTDYIRDEGKYLFLIYGILVVLYEIGAHIIPAPNFLNLPLFFLFSVAPIIRIPILDMIAAYIVTMVTVLAVSVYARYRVYKHWHPKNKHSL